jgi:hypothetical protein
MSDNPWQSFLTGEPETPPVVAMEGMEANAPHREKIFPTVRSLLLSLESIEHAGGVSADMVNTMPARWVLKGVVHAGDCTNLVSSRNHAIVVEKLEEKLFGTAVAIEGMANTLLERGLFGCGESASSVAEVLGDACDKACISLDRANHSWLDLGSHKYVNSSGSSIPLTAINFYTPHGQIKPEDSDNNALTVLATTLTDINVLMCSSLLNSLLTEGAARLGIQSLYDGAQPTIQSLTNLTYQGETGEDAMPLRRLTDHVIGEAERTEGDWSTLLRISADMKEGIVIPMVDGSVIEAAESALESPTPFSSYLTWLKELAAVGNLLRQAVRVG